MNRQTRVGKEASDIFAVSLFSDRVMGMDHWLIDK